MRETLGESEFSSYMQVGATRSAGIQCWVQAQSGVCCVGYKWLRAYQQGVEPRMHPC